LFSLFKAKTGYGRLDTAKSLLHSLWILSRSRSPKLKNVLESEYIQPKQEWSWSQKFHTPYTSANLTCSMQCCQVHQDKMNKIVFQNMPKRKKMTFFRNKKTPGN